LPFLSNLDISKLYSSNYISDHSQDTYLKLKKSTEIAHDPKAWDQAIERFRLFETRNMSCVDFGCSIDSPIIRLAIEMGHDVIGVEWDPTVCKIAKQKMGTQVITPDEFFQSSRSFDLIFLGDVLEHLSPPGVQLTKLVAKLKPGGTLMIQGPLEGNRSILNFFLAAKSKCSPGETDQPPYHTSLATKKSIEIILNRADLSIDDLTVHSTYWPALPPNKLFGELSFRNALLTLIQTIDVLLSKIFRNYGNRFLAIATLR
jgi:2-polyprenyl-3-methyl-5-hydroxy-6-metoxy-1,4-benzoquinol methylase